MSSSEVLLCKLARSFNAFLDAATDIDVCFTCIAQRGSNVHFVPQADAQREYAYGPAQGLADTKVGAFTQALYDEAKKDGWTVISMKNDWKRIFAFD